MEGTLKGGNVCEVIVQEHPSVKCGGRSDASGNCFVEETSAPILHCPHGYSEGTQNSCARIEAADLIVECPHSTHGPNCATYQPKTCPPGGCERVVSEPATHICPEGFIKASTHTKILEQGSHDTHSHKSGVKGKKSGGNHKLVTMTKSTCQKTEYAEHANRCPHGLKQVDDVTCASYVDFVVETKTHKLPAQHKCPPGYADKDHHCVHTTAVMASPICPAESFVQGNVCAHVVHMLQECPAGSISEKGTCWVFRAAEPLTVDTVVEAVHSHSVSSHKEPFSHHHGH